ncbi:MAG: hypothetical protein Q4C89_04160 [Deinococcus sp.]|uniref:hypothetical protein n=1 Tax=Deinococcus sp. TaxID=47478 RepID=UPI0026DD31D7|nr:hypothetical protein [Deinococcus sp.]MDO4245198.1 hypothetical protein [Deinococcus sp.]
MYACDLDPMTRAHLQEQYAEHGLHQPSSQAHASRRRRLSRALHWLERRLPLHERQRLNG